MAELISDFSTESVEEYALQNNLYVLNPIQIAAKFMELEQINSNLDDRVTKLERLAYTKPIYSLKE